MGQFRAESKSTGVDCLRHKLQPEQSASKLISSSSWLGWTTNLVLTQQAGKDECLLGTGRQLLRAAHIPLLSAPVPPHTLLTNTLIPTRPATTLPLLVQLLWCRLSSPTVLVGQLLLLLTFQASFGSQRPAEASLQAVTCSFGWHRHGWKWGLTQQACSSQVHLCSEVVVLRGAPLGLAGGLVELAALSG